MNGDLLSIVVVAIVFFGAISLVIAFAKRSRKKPLNVEAFTEKWKEAQKLCANKETWPLAIINADNVLDEALKKAGYRGKTMGERLVAAQRDLTDNDGVWYGHKLRNKLVHEADTKVKEADVKDALMGIRQALRDLGALKK
jgi:hypothetical protein